MERANPDAHPPITPTWAECQTCVYDMHGLPTGQACPECGADLRSLNPRHRVGFAPGTPPAISRIFGSSLYPWAGVTAVLMPPLSIVLSAVLLVHALRAGRCVREMGLDDNHPFASQARKARRWAGACMVTALVVLAFVIVFS